MTKKIQGFFQITANAESGYRLTNRSFLPLCLMLCLFCVARAAHAHVEDEYNSVHFHSGAPDFGTPPRRAIILGESDDRHVDHFASIPPERIGVELTEERVEKVEAAHRRLLDNMLGSAEGYVTRSEWDRARRTYIWIGRRFGWHGGLHSMRDRVEVLGRVAAMRTPLPAAFIKNLRLYLSGMDLYEQKKYDQGQRALEQVAADRAAGFLQEHATYQLASLAYEWLDFPGAVQRYQQFIAAFPHSSKREEALMMIARCAILPQTTEGRRLAAGRQALAQLRREFPHTRFRSSIVGLQARLDFLSGQYGDAIHSYLTLGDLPSVEIVSKAMPPAVQGRARVRLMAAYLRRLAVANDFDSYETAVRDIDRTRKSLSPAAAHLFSQILVEEPDLQSPYFYYRLYHCDNKPSDLAHLADLADKIVSRHSAAPLPPLVRVRLAEVYYQRRRYARALAWANRAMSGGAFDRALYVRGATLHKLKRYRTALADFTTLLNRFPNSPLRRGAREEAALLYEDLGDLAGALEQYFELDYQADIAFFLDARMSIPEIERYFTRHPDLMRQHLRLDWDRYGNQKPVTCTEGDLFAYTLGIRYLREERWNSAEHWLRRVPRTEYAAFSADRKEWDSNTTSPDPLTAIRDLRRLQRAVAERTGNGRAAALYRYASYYYTHGTLLLYNAALWQESRAESFDEWWNAKVATKQDVAAAHDHMYRHEVYVRALRICLEIANRYPRSQVAPEALYRGACCARHLADFNVWWREENKRNDHWKEAARLMRMLARRYPRNPLASHARKYARVFLEEGAGDFQY